MPLTSKIFFALAIVALICTAIIVILESIKYRKEVKAYRIVLNRLEAEEAKRLRLEKEAEVIRRFQEKQKEMAIEVNQEVVSSK